MITRGRFEVKIDEFDEQALALSATTDFRNLLSGFVRRRNTVTVNDVDRRSDFRRISSRHIGALSETVATNYLRTENGQSLRSFMLDGNEDVTVLYASLMNFSQTQGPVLSNMPAVSSLTHRSDIETREQIEALTRDLETTNRMLSILDNSGFPLPHVEVFPVRGSFLTI